MLGSQRQDGDPEGLGNEAGWKTTLVRAFARHPEDDMITQETGAVALVLGTSDQTVCMTCPRSAC